MHYNGMFFFAYGYCSNRPQCGYTENHLIEFKSENLGLVKLRLPY